MADNQISQLLLKYFPINIVVKIMKYNLNLPIFYKIKSKKGLCQCMDYYDTIEFSLVKFNDSNCNTGAVTIPFTYIYSLNTGYSCCSGYGRYTIHNNIIEDQYDIGTWGDSLIYYNIYNISNLLIKTSINEHLKNYAYDLVAYNKNISRTDNRHKCYTCNNTSKKTNRSYKALCKECRKLKFNKGKEQNNKKNKE